MKGRQTMNDNEKKVISEAAREARNRYHREWAQRNPEKVKAITNRYWERKSQEAAAKEG